MTLNPLVVASRAWNALRSGVANPQTGSMLQFIGRNSADVHVTHDRAFMVAAVWACIDCISSAHASSDWNVYAGRRGDDKKTVLTGDALQYILNTRFNPEMTAQAGKRAMMIAASGWGNGYAEIERDLSQRIVALWPIAPDRCQLVRDEFGNLKLRVQQNYQGGSVDLDMEDVFHIRGGSLTGLAGDDMIAKAIQSIAMAVAVDQFSGSYFANGAQLGLLVQYKGKLDDITYDRLQKQLNEKHKGSRKAFRTGVLEGDLTVTTVSSDADKAQLVEVKYQLIEEVARWFRVPPHKIGHLLRATNNNIEHQGLEFTRDTLRPWKVEIEQECDYKLFPQRGPSKFIEIDLDWAEQGDYGSRMQAYSVARAMGAFTVNDVLRKLGENTIGSEGDIRTMNGAAVRLEDVGKNMLPGAADAPATDAPASDGAETDDTATAWLTSVYARIQRRYDNGARNMEAAGHKDWQRRARDATEAYAEEQVKEMAQTLGARLDAATAWAKEVINGTDPKVAAVAAMESA